MQSVPLDRGTWRHTGTVSRARRSVQVSSPDRRFDLVTVGQFPTSISSLDRRHDRWSDLSRIAARSQGRWCYRIDFGRRQEGSLRVRRNRKLPSITNIVDARRSRASIPPRRIQGPCCFFRITEVVEYALKLLDAPTHPFGKVSLNLRPESADRRPRVEFIGDF